MSPGQLNHISHVLNHIESNIIPLNTSHDIPSRVGFPRSGDFECRHQRTGPGRTMAAGFSQHNCGDVTKKNGEVVGIYRGWQMSLFGDFGHNLQISVGDSIPNSWVMFTWDIYQPLI